VWFIHGSVPGRLMRAIDMLRCSLTEVLTKDKMVMQEEDTNSSHSLAS